MITGASSGVGHALALELSQRGHAVANLSRSPSDACEVNVACDVTDPLSVAAAWARLDELGFVPDVLVNNAGMDLPGPIVQFDWSDAERILRTNFLGLVASTAEFARRVEAARGTGVVLNISSTSAAKPFPGRAIYGASKAAVSHFSLSAAEELRPVGIRVYCIALGPCNTPHRRRMRPDEDHAAILQPAEAARRIATILESGDGLDAQVLTIR